MEQQRKTAQRQLLLQLICILLLLALLVTMLVTEAIRMGKSYSFEKATLASYTSYDTLSGYLFRNETALAAGGNNGPILYQATDGELVAKDTVVAQVYTDSSDTDRRERAALLQEQLTAAQNALTATEQTWQAQFVDGYAAAMRELSAGDLSQGSSSTALVSQALVKRDATAAETAAALHSEIASLQQQLEELIRHEPPPASIHVAESGYFYHTVDGYEALFGTDAAKELTPENLQTLLTSPQATDNTVGKLVAQGEWYLALPVSAELAKTYESGTSYNVLFTRSKQAYSLLLCDITYSADEAEALLLFLGEEGTFFPDALRRQSVRIEKETVTGLRIPAAALTSEGTVYVEEGGIARERTVTPVLTEQGCVLVGENSGLREGERILLSARRIYDGKVLN